MNASPASLALADSNRAGRPSAAQCFHCAEPVPAEAVSLVMDGERRQFCCEGCAAAARWIRDAQLQDYYQFRSARAGRVDADQADLSSWDQDDVQAGHVREIATGREITLLTSGMRCAACAWLIDRALAREPGVVEISANAVTGRIRLVWDPKRVLLSQVLRRLASLGYRPGLARGESLERERRSERRRWLLRIGIAGLGALQAMMFAEALYLDPAGQMPLPTRDFLRWVTFLVSTPVIAYAGWPFFAGAWRELRERRFGMDTLVTLGTALAYLGSVVETLRGGPQVWYDTAVMFVFLLLAARLVEQSARAVASAQVDALAQAQPAVATREAADGSSAVVPVGRLRAGDIVRVAPGEPLPADGQLIGQAAELSEALLTGEAQPVTRRPGDMLYAGSLCVERPLRLAVTGVGPSTRLSALTRLVEQAQAHRPHVAQVADRWAASFVLGLFAIATAVFLFWWHIAPMRAFPVLLSLLVISCPCALSMSVPAALAAAHGYLSRLGVLATRPNALEALARATDLVFDKTGTLSTGRLRLLRCTTAGGLQEAQALALATALERDSRHPIATAFATERSELETLEVREHPGQGISGQVAGRSLRIGTAAFAAGAVDDGQLWLGDGTQALARFELQEAARPESRAVVQALQQLGLQVHLYSGDAAQAVAEFATRLGIEDAIGRLTPEDKLARVRALQSKGRIVAMVGDGLNDAPVLAGADVSIVVAEGVALAQRSADLVMTQASLQRIPSALRLARRTQRIIRQNLGWAIGYNLVALPLAASGHVTPWIAALAMVVSSLTVTLNALRLSR